MTESNCTNSLPLFFSETEEKWCGIIDYEEGLALQKKIVGEIGSGQRTSVILGLEHPHVITLGNRSKQDPLIPTATTVPVVWIDRGGEATLHSEGQLVIYPLCRLRPHFEVRSWVEFLLQVTTRSLAELGIVSHSEGGTGLWTSRGKIAFVGLRIKSGVSHHGLSINVQNDLKLFSGIKACGVQNAQMDSVAFYRPEAGTHEFFKIWMKEFRRGPCLGANHSL